VGLQVREGENEVGFEREDFVEVGGDEGGDPRLFPAHPRRPHRIAGDADNARFLAEEIKRLNGLFGEADDALGWKHGGICSCFSIASRRYPYWLAALTSPNDTRGDCRRLPCRKQGKRAPSVSTMLRSRSATSRRRWPSTAVCSSSSCAARARPRRSLIWATSSLRCRKVAGNRLTTAGILDLWWMTRTRCAARSRRRASSRCRVHFSISSIRG